MLVSRDVGLSPATSATPVNCCHRSESSEHSVQTASLKRGGRWGRRQVSMALTARAAHVLQCPVQNDPRPRGGGNLLKTGPSSDWSLQLDSMKPESLVMAHQLRRREYVPGPCTHRPSHHGSRLYPKSPLKGAEGMDGDWDEVVTR